MKHTFSSISRAFNSASSVIKFSIMVNDYTPQQGWTGQMELYLHEYSIQAANGNYGPFAEDEALMTIGDKIYFSVVWDRQPAQRRTLVQMRHFTKIFSALDDLCNDAVVKLQDGATLCEVYETLGGYEQEHKAMLAKERVGQPVFRAKHLGSGLYFFQDEIWESADEMIAYYGFHKPNVTVDLRESDCETFDGLLAKGTYIVRKGTRPCPAP